VDEGGGAADNLSGSRWNLVSLDGQPPIEGSTITLDFLNGDLGGSAGCNSYSAPYTLDGDTLSVGTATSTMMACEGVMDQETLYLAMLGSAESLAAAEESLTIHTPEGDLVYEPATDASLEGTAWALSGIVENDAVSSAAVDEGITASFENGQLSGFAGCNDYSAEYVIEGEVVNLGDIASTLMACEEEERTEREQAFLSALQDAAAYRIERDTLTLLDANGNPLLVFNAQNAAE
jgi:heat shock protein HslJ